MSLVDNHPQELESGRDNTNSEPRKSLWTNWYIASLMVAVAISFVGVGLVSPLRTLFARSEGATGGEVGLMGAAYLFSSFVFLFPFGWLSDRYNRVNIIVLGLIAHFVITIAYLPITDGGSFIVLRFFEGISSAAVLPASRALLVDLVPRKRSGEAFGMMSAMMTMGIFIGPPIGTFLAEAFGYSLAYWIAAAAYLPATLLVLFAFRGYHSSQQHKEAKAAREISKDEPKEKLLTRPIVVGLIVRFSMALGPGMGITLWSLYMADLGYSLTLIGWTYTVYAIPIVLFSSRAGRFSDRYGRLPMMLGAGSTLGLLWASYGFVPFFLFFMVMGVVEGIFDAIARSANDGYLADHSPANNRGRAQGFFSAITQLGSLAAALAAGFLYETFKGGTFILIGGFQFSLVLVAALLALSLRGKVTSNK